MSYFRATLLSSVILGPGVSLFGLLLLSGCSDKIVTCQESKTCEASGGSGDGDSGDIGSGGNTNSGGKGSGGDSNSSGGAQGGSTGDGDGDTGSGGDILDPCDACGGDKPVCVDDDCVACSETEQGSCSEEEVCSDENECVECTLEEHCVDPAVPVCDTGSNECTGCTDSEDCAHLGDASEAVCEPTSGACVECLTEDDCDGFVCHPAEHVCTSLVARDKFACEPCLRDAECQEGQLCVMQTFDNDGVPTEIGTFCTWTKAGRTETEDGSCIDNGRPFARGANLTSVDGVTADLCVLATTTCPAYLDHRVTPCLGATDDAACGAPDLDDGLCESVETTNRCTYACLSDEDCKPGSDCSGSGYCEL